MKIVDINDRLIELENVQAEKE